MSKGKRYTQEFKIEAVKQITERGYSVAEVSERLGICTKTLYHWRSQLSDKPKQTKSSDCSGQLIPDIKLRFSSALAGENPLL